MLRKASFVIVLICAAATVSAGQNSNSSAPRPSRTPPPSPTSTPPPAPAGRPSPQSDGAGAQSSRTRRAGNSGASDPTSKGVLAAFDSIIEGIEKSDVEMVTGGYWNSTQLTLFNNNGTVTRGWEQMRKNRESSYPNMKDVKLTVRDRRILMLGRDAALVTCLWTQSQTYKGAPETASGRMTLVFQRINGVWKAVHLHTSPDAPDPSRIAPSEQVPATNTTPRSTP
jgi:ketosteroid isomerase-like protein